MGCPKIKICGVATLEAAQTAALAGVDYMGLVFHPSSKRAVTVSQACAITAVARTHGAIPVAVFTDHSAQQMLDICMATEITTVQLHGARARQAHRMLAPKYRRFYVCPVSKQGRIAKEDEQGLTHCDPKRDYVLFDHQVPGTGQCFDWAAFHYQGVFPMIVAGGLRRDNVNDAIRRFQPAMVDVSSGVEDRFGEKDAALITQFIQTVRGVA